MRLGLPRGAAALAVAALGLRSRQVAPADRLLEEHDAAAQREVGVHGVGVAAVAAPAMLLAFDGTVALEQAFGLPALALDQSDGLVARQMREKASLEQTLVL